MGELKFLHTINNQQNFQVSRCGHHLVLAGRATGGEGVLVWQEWPFKTSAPVHVILRGHIVHHMEFKLVTKLSLGERERERESVCVCNDSLLR